METRTKIIKYVSKHAKRNNITMSEAIRKGIVQNVIAWIKLKEGE